jgi:hypothetical protein
MRKRVYIAGPISLGDRSHNLYQSWVAEKQLMEAGFAPLNPMNTMQLPFAWDDSFTHADWLARCYPWIEVADVVLRLPGESKGADSEVRFAHDMEIPVYYDLEVLIEHEL